MCECGGCCKSVTLESMKPKKQEQLIAPSWLVTSDTPVSDGHAQSRAEGVDRRSNR
jgi:hypothetical protein